MEAPHAGDSNKANAWAAGNDFARAAGPEGVGAEEGGDRWMVAKLKLVTSS